jgi:hypothetical protein
MNAESKLALSVEELMLSLVVMDRRETAAGLMRMSFDPMPDEELEIRLLTAGHSLAARGWLKVDEEAGTKQIDEHIQSAIRPLADAEFSLRLSKIEQGEEQTLAIHICQDLIAVHSIEQGFIHRLARLNRIEDIPSTVEEFFAPQAGDAKEDLASEEVERMFSEDMSLAEGAWTVMRVEYDEQRIPYTDEGFLMLQGNDRFWLMWPHEDEDQDFAVQAGTTAAFRDAVMQLLKTAAPL